MGRLKHDNRRCAPVAAHIAVRAVLHRGLDMTPNPFTFPTAAADSLVRAIVTSINGDGWIVVAADTDGAKPLVCDRLVTGAEPVKLCAGDVVLCHAPPGTDRGVILGRILAPAAESVAHSVADPVDPPTVLILEAKEELTLRVGDGFITIRSDGKILIKGKDLVSHASRVNRIKGGAVSIN
jgi:hypothetical protein